MRDHPRDTIRPLWDQHRETRFPPSLRGEEIDGVDMVMIDADIAGCVDSWLHSSQNLDAGRIKILRACHEDLERVLPRLMEPEEVEYFSGVLDVADAVLKAQDGWN